LLFQVDADRAKALEIDILAHQPAKVSGPPGMGVLVQTVGILAITTVGGPTTGLHVSNAISVRTEHTQKRFRCMVPATDFHVIRLLKTHLLYPEMRELQNQILKIEALRFFSSFTLAFKSSPEAPAF